MQYICRILGTSSTHLQTLHPNPGFLGQESPFIFLLQKPALLPSAFSANVCASGLFLPAGALCLLYKVLLLAGRLLEQLAIGFQWLCHLFKIVEPQKADRSKQKLLLPSQGTNRCFSMQNHLCCIFFSTVVWLLQHRDVLARSRGQQCEPHWWSCALSNKLQSSAFACGQDGTLHALMSPPAGLSVTLALCPHLHEHHSTGRVSPTYVV